MAGRFRNNGQQVCAALPGAECSDTWGGGHDAWEVGGKMFASVGAVSSGVSVKTADIHTAHMLIDAGVATRAAYFHRSWVHLPEDCARDELKHRLCVTYDIIRASLAKKVRSALPARWGIA
jgi:predicted DNA-binding protein (MmcQ/YjbR family)